MYKACKKLWIWDAQFFEVRVCCVVCFLEQSIMLWRCWQERQQAVKAVDSVVAELVEERAGCVVICRFAEQRVVVEMQARCAYSELCSRRHHWRAGSAGGRWVWSVCRRCPRRLRTGSVWRYLSKKRKPDSRSRKVLAYSCFYCYYHRNQYSFNKRYVKTQADAGLSAFNKELICKSRGHASPPPRYNRVNITSQLRRQNTKYLCTVHRTLKCYF